MPIEIQRLEAALIYLASCVESGEWNGVEEAIKKILGYNETNLK